MGMLFEHFCISADFDGQSFPLSGHTLPNNRGAQEFQVISSRLCSYLFDPISLF